MGPVTNGVPDQHGRACLRCMGRKRKCDRKRPTCGECDTAGQICQYPSIKRRRGPIAGQARAIESRVWECERIIWFLLQIREAEAALRAYGEGHALPDCPLHRTLAGDVPDYLSQHPLRTAGDVLEFRDACLSTEDVRNVSVNAVRARMDDEAGFGQDTSLPDTEQRTTPQINQPELGPHLISQSLFDHGPSGSSGPSMRDPAIRLWNPRKQDGQPVMNEAVSTTWPSSAYGLSSSISAIRPETLPVETNSPSFLNSQNLAMTAATQTPVFTVNDHSQSSNEQDIDIFW